MLGILDVADVHGTRFIAVGREWCLDVQVALGRPDPCAREGLKDSERETTDLHGTPRWVWLPSTARQLTSPTGVAPVRIARKRCPKRARLVAWRWRSRGPIKLVRQFCAD